MDPEKWIVVLARETETPSLMIFAEERDARTFFDDAAAQWTGVYLCRVVIGGGVSTPEERRALAAAWLAEEREVHALRARVALLEAELREAAEASRSAARNLLRCAERSERARDGSEAP